MLQYVSVIIVRWIIDERNEDRK